jgi:tryptophan-rich sensory protein
MSLLQAAGLTLFPPVAGFLSGWSTKNEVKTWYEPKLDKPSWRPPNWYSTKNIIYPPKKKEKIEILKF